MSAIEDRLWHRRVWHLAGPIILSNISVPLLGAVDTAVMGHLPDPAYIGGVAVGALIFSLAYWAFGFLRMGTTGFTAQAFGAGDPDSLRACLGRPLILAAAIAAVLVAAQVPILALALTAISPSEQVAGLAADYFAIRIWGAPATLAMYAVLGWLLGLQNARAVLLLQVALNSLNIALDLIFVLGFGWGIQGVAAATLISEYAALGLGVVIIRRTLAALPGHWDLARLRNRERLIALLRVNADIFVRTLCLEAAFFLFTTVGARFGDTTLAANAILLQMQTFLAYGLDGFAHAVEVLAGAALGAGRRSDFRRAVIVSTQWAAATALIMTAVFGLGGGAIVSLFTDIEEVREVAAVYLPWIVISPLLSVWSYQLDGIFIGATRTGAMRNAMVGSLLAFLAVAWLLVPAYGNHGLWGALLIFMVARALTLGAYYPSLERSVMPRSGPLPG